MKTKEETLRTRERIRARATQRHKARDKALPAGQRPVKHLWLLTVVFSFDFLLTIFITWTRRSELTVLLHSLTSVGLGALHTPMWPLLYAFNVFMLPIALISVWQRAFRAQAERNRVKEQRKATRALGGAGIWPPLPRA